MAKWGAMHKIDRKPTGEFRRALIGSAKGEIGEIVFYHKWGGVDLRFEDGTIATYASDDIERVEND